MSSTNGPWKGRLSYSDVLHNGPGTSSSSLLPRTKLRSSQLPIWGYSVSFGIFQEYYSRPPSPISSASSGTIATIGALQQGVMYLMMPFTFLILTKYPRLRQYCGPVGLLITTSSLTASAFVDSVAGLIATQGAIYSTGCGLLFCPISHYMNEWFVERKGMALGVMWAGKSATGTDTLLQVY